MFFTCYNTFVFIVDIMKINCSQALTEFEDCPHYPQSKLRSLNNRNSYLTRCTISSTILCRLTVTRAMRYEPSQSGMQTGELRAKGRIQVTHTHTHTPSSLDVRICFNLFQSILIINIMYLHTMAHWSQQRITVH